MSIGNLKDYGNKGNNFPYQLAVLKLLDQINSSIAALPGVDYETRTSTYQAVANGAGYSTGDIIIRYDIIDVATSTIASTVWFNDTTQAVIGAPAPGDITPVSSPSSVTVINGPLGAAVNIQDGGNSITVDDGGTPLNVQGTLGSNTNDGAGNPITSTVPAIGVRALDVNVTNPLSLIVDQSTSSILVYGFDGTNNQPIATDTFGNVQVNILSIPTVDVSGSSVSVSNFPITQDVNIVSSITLDVTGSTVGITGNVTVDQGTSPWIIDGTVQSTQLGTWTIDSIANPVIVTALGLDIRQLDFLLDSVDVSNSSNVGVTNANLDVQLSTLATETTVSSIDAKIPANLTVSATRLLVDGSGVTQPVSGTISANQSGSWDITNITGTVSLPTGAATETTLASVDTRLTPQVRTHNTISTSTSGTIGSGSLRGSVLNVGNTAGTWNGISLPAGVSLPWDAIGNRDTYGAISYDATGTTFIIEYTT